MAEHKFKSLRRLGAPMGVLADLLTILTQNWGVLVSAAFAIWAGLSKATFRFLNDPHVQTIGNLFIWTLWTYIGLSFLYRIHTGIKTQPYVDYAFGVIIEGIGLAVDQQDDGNFQPSISFRNVVNGAIKIQVTECRSIIEGVLREERGSSVGEG
jgi:hypothetical protein